MKKIKGSLVGQDGNAFALMGYFSKQARKSGWDKKDIDGVIKKAMSGNYDNLLATLSQHFE